MASEISIVEIREDQMVDPTCFNANPNPTRRTAHFLKPSLNPNSEPPSPPLKIQSFSVTSRPNIKYLCGSQPLQGWQTWVKDLEATHGPLWRKAGIFDAIKASTYTISRDTHLIFRLAERWCPQTNTFVFPWGEASITLEDVFVLGGFSPLGESVLSASLEDNAKQVENKLIKSYQELARINNYPSHLRWKEHFIGCGNEIEHAGFLALWLARHVIPSRSGSIVWRGALPIAARVCCGGKLAYGPVILASIYRDLTLLKTKIVSGYCFDSLPLKLSSPLQLVQVWAWERFARLGPVPKMIKCGETRLGRWEGRKRNLHDDIGMLLDSARDTFRWRPYAISLENWTFSRFYIDSETWVMVDSEEEWKMIARFLMVSQLVGLDCIEGYNPHRVALQFGFDQDIPECIDRYKASCDACEPDLLEYEKNLNGLKLYIPHRLHEGDVTYRYSNWLKRPNPVEETRVGYKRRTTTMTKAKKTSKIYDTGNELVAVEIGWSVSENPVEKLQPLQEFSSQQLLQGGSVNEMTGMLNLQCEVSSEEHTSMEEDEENEARRNNISVGEAVNEACNNTNKYSNAAASETEPMATANTLIEYNINIVHDKSAEIKLSQGADCMKPSGVRFPCNEVGQNKEQMSIKQNVMIKENKEYLEEVDKCRSETASEVNTLSLVTEKSEPKKALCEDTDINNADIPVDDQVAVRNPFAVLCFQYETRISELEREISALSAAAVISANFAVVNMHV